MTTATFTIRTATAADAPVLAVLFTAFNQQVGVMGLPAGADKGAVANVTAAQMAERLAAAAGRETVYLAEDAGRIAGLAALRLVPHLDQDAPYAELTQLYVEPEYRRSGVGSALVATVEAAAKKAGATALYLLTDVENRDAQAFYRASGFSPNYVCFEKVLS